MFPSFQVQDLFHIYRRICAITGGSRNMAPQTIGKSLLDIDFSSAICWENACNILKTTLIIQYWKVIWTEHITGRLAITHMICCLEFLTLKRLEEALVFTTQIILMPLMMPNWIQTQQKWSIKGIWSHRLQGNWTTNLFAQSHPTPSNDAETHIPTCTNLYITDQTWNHQSPKCSF